jgi:hypothetical protein
MSTSRPSSTHSTGPPIRLDATFLVRREQEVLRILAYRNHRDITQLLAAPIPS